MKSDGALGNAPFFLLSRQLQATSLQLQATSLQLQATSKTISAKADRTGYDFGKFVRGALAAILETRLEERSHKNAAHAVCWSLSASDKKQTISAKADRTKGHGADFVQVNNKFPYHRFITNSLASPCRDDARRACS